MKFSELNLIEPLMRALDHAGYEQPTPIQQKAIPPILEGKDVFGCAQTGTGKTAAFTLPMLQLLGNGSAKKRHIRGLVLAPTRELAMQISANMKTYGHHLPLRHTVVFGGVSQNPQVQQLRKGVDVLIATPGRLLDLMQQGFIRLDRIEFLVLDEADRMLDMGFIHDIKRILAKLPAERQNLLFSATASPEIMKLVKSMMKQIVRVSATPKVQTAELVDQSVYFVAKDKKRSLLKHVLRQKEVSHALVFTRTKRGADRVAKDLVRAGINAEAIHGNKSQGARERALKGFKNRSIQVLIATDIASRGIDVDKLSHVINFEIPEVAETYVHRIGRTGRAGSPGKAFSFCTPDEMPYWKDIHKLVRKDIPEVRKHPFALS